MHKMCIRYVIFLHQVCITIPLTEDKECTKCARCILCRLGAHSTQPVTGSLGWSVSLFGQQIPAAPYWRSCAAKGMKSAITDVSYAASLIPILIKINSMAIVSRFSFPALRTMASSGCPFQQDVRRNWSNGT